MLSYKLRNFIMAFAAISVSSLIIFQCNQIFGEERQKYKYLGNAGCKCHLAKGCFEGEEYKKMKNQHYNTFSRLETDEDKKNPECLSCHATALDMKISKGRSKLGNFIEDVGCEACHGPGEAYVKVKKNYNNQGKDAFKKLLEEDPMTARKVQYDTGLYVAGINKYKTIKEQCLNCHWEDANAKNKCPKSEGKKNSENKDRIFTDSYIKRDDHRDNDAIDDVLAKMSDADKKKWKGYIEQDPWYKTKPPNAK
jgi:hypothetical protein